jgi:predicted transcriptional regulator
MDGVSEPRFQQLQSEIQKPERRDQLGLLLDLLRETTEPVKKTHLLYRTRMNYYQITHYVGLLQKWDMIESISQPFEGFRITDKGRILLNLFLGA